MNSDSSVSLRTAVCGLLGCDHPIVLAGMGGVARSELALAVTRAGGFGFLGMVRESPELIRREVEAMRRGTSKPFGINIIPAATEPDLLEDQVKICIDLRVPVIALFWDLRADLVRRFRDNGMIVVCQVGSAGEGRAAQDAGAQALIAQGVEAGGHVRGRTPLRNLLRDLVPECTVPVLAAGGMVDGRDLVGALQLGAQAIVIGTAFLAAPESFAHDYHKQRIVESKASETIITDMFHINWPQGASVRVLQNSTTRDVAGNPFGARQVIGEEEGRPIYLYSTDSPLRSMTGQFERMALYAGRGVDRIDAVVPARDRIAAIINDAARLLEEGACPTAG